MEELKQKYKNLHLWARLGLLVILGLLPALYSYLDQGEEFETRLMEAQNQEQTVRLEFEKARQRKASLPKLEEELAFTEDQLARAKKLLPDQVRIEEILEKVALISKETNVSLLRFRPEQTLVHDDVGGYRYVEIPIETEILGTYQKIASFFDQIAHLETAIFVREITIVPDTQNNQRNGAIQERAQADFGNPLPGAQGLKNLGLPTPDQIEATLTPRITVGPGGAAVVQNPTKTKGADIPGLGGPNENPNLRNIDPNRGNFQETAKFKLVLYRGGNPSDGMPVNPGAPG